MNYNKMTYEEAKKLQKDEFIKHLDVLRDKLTRVRKALSKLKPGYIYKEDLNKIKRILDE